MALFARVTGSTVETIVVVHDDHCPTEADGLRFLADIGLPGRWIQTSETGAPIEGEDRGPCAGVGYEWDGSKFIPPPSPDSDFPTESQGGN